MKARKALYRLNRIAASETYERLYFQSEAQGTARPTTKEIEDAVSEIRNLTAILQDAVEIAEHAIDTVVSLINTNNKCDKHSIIAGLDHIATHAEDTIREEEINQENNK